MRRFACLTSSLTVLAAVIMTMLSGCFSPTSTWSPPSGTTTHAELFVRYGEIRERFYMSYSADDAAIVIRKSIPQGEGDLRSHVKVVAEQRVPCSPRNAWAFTRTVAGLDLHGHAQSRERRKDIADGPYYVLYIDGKVEAQGWTPEFDELYLHVLETVVLRQFGNATK